jgi:glycogen debranching enzyme
MGLSHYAMQRDVLQVLGGVYAAARNFRHYRLPELFCGMERRERDEPVNYPVSCSPQAWASGALFLLVRACLGIYPDAPRRALRIVNPQLPEWMDELTLRGLRVGNSRVSLRFTRTGDGCFAAVTETKGDSLSLRIEVG